MAMTNEEIANILEEIADVLEEQEDNPYRTRAYRRAANSIKRYSDNLSDLVQEGHDLTVIPYVGIKLAEVIKQIVNGSDVIPKSKSATPYPDHLHQKERKQISYRIYSIIYILERMLTKLRNSPHVKKLEPVGDYRRKKEVITDCDIIAVTDNVADLFKIFHEIRSVKYIIETTPDSTTVQLKLGIRITLRVVSENEWGASLLYFTGSTEHYDQLKSLVHKRKLNLSPSGLIQTKHIVSATEKEIYHALKLSYIPPELRENRGEVTAAAEGQLPKLVEITDIKGDLHCHTTETDGSFSLEEMVATARSQGYQYVAITDHSQSLRITNGMDEKRLLKQMAFIDQLNEQFTDFRILKSMEIDILEDGSLDLAEDVLKQLDLTVCSVHSKFRLSKEKQTERILKAMDNPYFNILGHATSRLIKHRPPYEVDMERILYAAKERNCFIEVNAQPARLDINDLYCKRAKEIGVKVAISSDAHTLNGFNFMILGVNQARRGWLEAKDVINTYPLEQLKKALKK